MKFLFLLVILSVGFTPACKTSKRKKKAQTEQTVKVEKSLNGGWELNYITAEADLFSFEELFPARKPTLTFDVKSGKVSGNTSCNNFNGELKTDGNKISFNHPMAMTKMLCEGSGEEKFLEMLKKVDSYSISDDNVLALMSGDVAILRFTKGISK